jgi:diguanylate cyclase
MQMIRDLFVNFTIIVASFTLANMMLRERFYTDNLRNFLINGFLAGLLGCLLMVFGVDVAPGVFIDYRHIPVLIMALSFSPVSAIETALIIGFFRLFYFGLSSASITAFTVIIFYGVICSLVGKMKVSMKIKWLISVVSYILIAGAGIYFLVEQLSNKWVIMIVFVLGISVASLLMYFLADFLSRSNRFYETLKDEVDLDYLTGLKNSRFFDKSFNQHVRDAIDENRCVSLLYIDIDHFKKINDQYGHANGDIVLQDLSRILRQTARSNDVVTRRGGEEFTILLADCSLAHAANAAERVRRMVEEHEFQLSPQQAVGITVSIGVSSFPETAGEEQALLEQADTALYQAKRDGRNRIACFDLLTLS